MTLRGARGGVVRAVAYGIGAILAALCAPPISAETVQISLPAIVSFTVPDVGAGTRGSPEPTTVAFSGAVLDAGRALRISVKAEGNLTGPGGSIAASQVSWATANVLNGVASNGELSASAYLPVFEGQAGASSGGVDLVWTLSAPGGSMNAGVYQVTLRWKLEAITP